MPSANGLSVKGKDNINGYHGFSISSDNRSYSSCESNFNDLICIGFGPASLAIAVAMHDSLESLRSNGTAPKAPKVKFLERQSRFGWHAGMLLNGTKMQISFIKDLATLRDPRSKFTFLNYLKEHNRLVQFSNLGTFLPSRLEFENYMRWVAAHFENVVDYSREVISIRPGKSNIRGKFDHLEVETRSIDTQEIFRYQSRNVVIATGGSPNIPKVFPRHHPRVLHSSQYGTTIEKVLSETEKCYDIAVVGSGQSAAEVFRDLHSRFPNAHTRLIFRDTALRPSDDSPFVNEVFDPDAVDQFFTQPPLMRDRLLERNRATNYSVVRLELLEKIYEEQYLQSVQQPDRNLWQHQIIPAKEVTEVVDKIQENKIGMTLGSLNPSSGGADERLSVDVVVVATGYQRDLHVEMLKHCECVNGSNKNHWQAKRDYSLELDRNLVEDGVGIWLQGCNEETHGLSDTLLSILATRSGELVESIFGWTTQHDK